MSLQSWPLSSLLKAEPESPFPGVKRDSISLPLHLAVPGMLWVQVGTLWRWAGMGKDALPSAFGLLSVLDPSLIPSDPRTPWSVLPLSNLFLLDCRGFQSCLSLFSFFPRKRDH